MHTEDKPTINDEQTKNDKPGWGCFALTFIMIASGIPMATKGEGPVGTTVIIIAGLAVAFFIARALSGRD